MNRLKMLFHKNSYKAFHLDKNVIPIIFIPKYSEYTAAFQKKLNKCPITLSEICLEVSMEDYVEEGSAQQAGLKLYMDKAGKIVESQNSEQGMVQLGTLSGKIGEKRILGIQNREQHIFISLVKLVIVILLLLSFKRLKVNTRTENWEDYLNYLSKRRG